MNNPPPPQNPLKASNQDLTEKELEEHEWALVKDRVFVKPTV
jgi:hypothetical protein